MFLSNPVGHLAPDRVVVVVMAVLVVPIWDCAYAAACPIRDHPIAPVMLYDARLAAQFAEEMLKRGIYVVGFSYPVRRDS